MRKRLNLIGDSLKAWYKESLAQKVIASSVVAEQLAEKAKAESLVWPASYDIACLLFFFVFIVLSVSCFLFLDVHCCSYGIWK